jgi:hypothetical protein
MNGLLIYIWLSGYYHALCLIYFAVSCSYGVICAGSWLAHNEEKNKATLLNRKELSLILSFLPLVMVTFLRMASFVLTGERLSV